MMVLDFEVNRHRFVVRGWRAYALAGSAFVIYVVVIGAVARWL